ncbi:MAG TPA: ATP-binding protein [Xanthomonadales bacterium]|nr:ATP-binding protein [Xanthomonadales bacterium]
MIPRLLLSLLVAVVVGIGTFEVWKSLTAYREAQVSRMVNTESYASRSQLVRNVERSLQALQSAQMIWTNSSRLRSKRWQSDADAEMEKLGGLTTLLWDDPDQMIRFARTEKNPVFDFRPDDAEWQGYHDLLTRARSASANTMAGPFVAENGRAYFEVYLVETSVADTGRLAAVVDAGMFLQQLLQDDSPGYAVKVNWGKVLLYERGEPAAGIPIEWTVQGKIQTSMNALWNVAHAPTQELVDSFAAPAIDLILLLGLIIAVLMATLTFENWRAYSRAKAAENAERQLAELNRNLEEQIHQRTRELANRTADLQTIADSVAHDMRNPLNVISVNLALFEAQNESVLPVESLSVLQRIPPAVGQMADILDRLLGLSTVAHSTFHRETLDMREMVEEVFEDLQASEPGSPVELQLGELPDVQADEKLVNILLLNLLANAFKYTRGKPQRRIEVSSCEQDGVTVYSVADNGVGFDQRSAERMFDAFHRLDEGKATSGLGLGLAIVARVVSRHKGRIWADGVPGQKAVFHFTLEPAQVVDRPVLPG